MFHKINHDGIIIASGLKKYFFHFNFFFYLQLVFFMYYELNFLLKHGTIYTP